MAQEQNNQAKSNQSKEKTNANQLLGRLGISNPFLRYFSNKFQTVIEQPSSVTYKFLIRQKFVQTYGHLINTSSQNSGTQQDSRSISTNDEALIEKLKTQLLGEEQQDAGVPFKRIDKQNKRNDIIEALYARGYEVEQFISCEDARRIKREQEFSSYIKINEAAINIQKVYKGHYTKNSLINLVEYKYQQEMLEPATKLQSIFRQTQYMKLVKREYLIVVLRSKISNAIIKLQARVKGIQTRKQIKKQYILRKLIDQRKKAAIVIQKNYKMLLTSLLYNKILYLENNYISLKWTLCDPLPSTVEVIGSFTHPPWEKPLQLEFCPLRGIFVKYMSNMQEGSYLIKFVVDGAYKCDPNLPIIKDASGHNNNLLEITIDDPDAQSSSERASMMDNSMNKSITSSLIKGLRGHGDKTPKSSYNNNNGHNTSGGKRKLKIKSSSGSASMNKMRLRQLDSQSQASNAIKKSFEQYYHVDDISENQNIQNLNNIKPKTLSKVSSFQQEELGSRRDDFEGFNELNPSQQSFVISTVQTPTHPTKKPKKTKKKTTLVTFNNFYDEDQISSIAPNGLDNANDLDYNIYNNDDGLFQKTFHEDDGDSYIQSNQESGRGAIVGNGDNFNFPEAHAKTVSIPNTTDLLNSNRFEYQQKKKSQ